MSLDNNTGKPAGFYERGKALFDRIPPFIPKKGPTMTTLKKYPASPPLTTCTIPVPTMQVICLTTTDGIAHEFFGSTLLKKSTGTATDPPTQSTIAIIQSIDFGPELTVEEVQDILALRLSNFVTVN